MQMTKLSAFVVRSHPVHFSLTPKVFRLRAQGVPYFDTLGDFIHYLVFGICR
jgi:hypothetical protein